MPLRRLFYRWRLAAVVALPAWLFLGWGFFGQTGWGFLGLLVLVPVVLIALGAVALLIGMRPTARETRAASWPDVAVLAAWHASLVGLGFFGETATLFGVLALLLGIAAFWLALWQLMRDGSRRMQAFAEAQRRAAGTPPGRLPPEDGGEYLVIRESRD
ncbi:hypothetical protein [Agromyces archimandritae]|uniref:Uncharacterized protein n=1 Tax=Agromyces archimandritae TaxID=2781962 RepID=A0A975FNX4_9MICO|nr:hypothetical protein [Agromyces archimandritae]QTX04486.1 hypothetical protein G127AT_14655 [Agromyces archimandritae]